MSSTTPRAMKVAARPGASGTSIFRSSSALHTSTKPFCICRGEMACTGPRCQICKTQDLTVDCVSRSCAIAWLLIPKMLACHLFKGAAHMQSDPKLQHTLGQRLQTKMSFKVA